jgi:hypothetical protein
VDELDDWGDDDRRGHGVDREDVRAAFCRKLAEQTLSRNGISEPPTPVDQLAAKLGFTIGLVQLAPGVDARMRVIDGRHIIELATGQAQVRQRFSIAHEIGHHLLGHRHGESDLAERQAHIFAGALLVPPTWLRRDLADGATADSLARRYDVSREVIFIAAKDARLLKRLL